MMPRKTAAIRVFIARCSMALLAVACLMTLAPAAQEPTLPDALRRAAAYVADFQQQLATIVAEESYIQEVTHQQSARGGEVFFPRRLRSDLLLVRPAGADRYVEYRDVFEVDGEPVRDRSERVTRLLKDPAGGDKLGAIIRESARYNIGRVTRTINTPLMPLLFLTAAYQPRFSFTRETKSDPVLRDSSSREITDASVFKVSTEMWTVRYQERQRNTVIRSPDGRDAPAHGRFWINPDTGAVLISELVVHVVDLTATIIVSYQSEPLHGFLVPVEMRETYVSPRDRVQGAATYGRFRAVK